MVRIQLETGYLEVKEGTKLPLNFGVADIRDISKRSGTFSKSITLIGSSNNNNLLNSYYDVNIQAGTFNIDTLTICSILENGIPVVEDAYLQLVSIDKTQHDNGHDEIIEYTVLIKDAQADFFTKIDNAELTDLDFTDLNHTYSSANIVASHTNTVTDGYVYPITANPISTYYIASIRPAIYTKMYWDRIHSTNGFSYEWSDITVDKFDLTVIPYNGDFPEVDLESYVVEFNKTSFIPALDTTITSWTETLDDENIFNPTTGVYDVPFYINGSQAINFEINLECDINLINASGGNATLTDLTTSGNPFGIEYQAKVRVVKNGAAFGLITLPIGQAQEFLSTDNPLANGNTNLGSINSTITFGVSNVLPTDTLTFEVDVAKTPTSILLSFLQWQDGGGANIDSDITEQLDITSMSVIATTSVNTLGFGQQVIVNNFVPKKIKQKDLIKWICFRWNLYVEQDKDNPNKLIYKTRDKYYDEGAEKDWTLKLAKDRKQNLQFLPELSSKKVILSDKIDKDNYNQVYLDGTNEVYGQLEYTYTNEYVKGTDRKSTIFSPTPMLRTVFNAVVPSINGNTPQNNIRLLIHNGTDTCDPYDILDFIGSGQTGLTTYPVVSHFDNNINPTFDLNFGLCDYYFYDGFTKTNNNMYNTFWRRTINQINTGKMLIAYFDLREADIQTLELSDKIRINNSWWNINKVIDYNANGLELTKVELLSADTEIELTSFDTTTPIKVTGNLGVAPFNELASLFYKDNNLNYSEGSTTIKGINNIVSPNIKAYVLGDNGIIDSDGYWLNGVKIGGGSETSNTYSFLPVSSNYTIDCEVDEIIEVVASGITLTLPDRRDCVGKKIYIKNYSGGGITVDTFGSSIDGDTTQTLSDKESITVTSDDTRWIIL